MSKTSMDRRVEAYGRWILRWRWPVMVATVVAVVALAAGMANLGLSANYRVFFGKDNPELAAFEAVQNIYTKNDSILFVLTPEDGQVFSTHTLAAVHELTEEAWQIPYSIRVDSITNFQHSRGEADDLIVEDLVTNPTGLTAAELENIRQIATSRPELNGRLIADAGNVTGINVILQFPGEDPQELIPSVAAAREIASRIEEAYPHVEVRLTGLTMLNNAFFEAGIRDLGTLVPLMYGVLIVAMILLLRSVSGTIATVLVIGFSAATALGIAGWLGTLLEPVSALAPTMILTMAIADSIHILATFFDGMRAGQEKRPAIIESLRVNMVPVFLTSLTTAIGFLSMNFSDSPPFNRLGNITAGGVVAAFVFSVTFLPAFISILPVRVRPRPASAPSSIFERLGDFVVARRKPVMAVMVVLIALVVAFVPANEVSDRFVQYFDESIDFRRDSDYTTANLTGIYQLVYSLPSGEAGGISNPEYLDALDRFADWFREQPDVVNVSTLSDVLRRLNMNLHGDDASYYSLPTDRDLAAQYLLLYEMSLPYGLDLNNQIDVDKSATRFIVTTGDVATKDFLALADRSERWLEANAPEHMHVAPTGPAVMFSHITERNIRSMIFGTAAAFLIISLVLTVALRSWKLGALSLIPNLVPAAMAFGAWGLIVGEMGFAVSVVAAMTMGIVVDDTVHFLTKYLRARREKELDAGGAVRYAFNSVGRALWITSAVLVAGFVVLAQSTFKQNSDMGLLAAVTILFALVADFFLLPTILIWLDRPGREREAESSRERTTPSGPVAQPG